jgi:anti-anti-sigma factor
MQITEKKEENLITLEVNGQVDTVTAPELQTAILTAFQKCANVMIDMNGVAYMSSAGLRSLLIGQKTAASKGGSLKLTGVQEPVMQVFNMSGFAKVLTIV